MHKGSIGKLLNNPAVIRWCYEGLTEVSLKTTSNESALKESKKFEKDWGNRMIGEENSKQWTTKLCEEVVREALIRLGRKNVRNTDKKKSTLRNKKYDPDLECDEFVYEVKGRGWNTPGTAGEKILGVPLKYGEVPRLYGKPLKIVLVGYQEYEAREHFAFGDLLDSSEQTEELTETLKFHQEHNIEYVAFTNILKQIGFEEDSWK